jgi:hypothetical protein
MESEQHVRSYLTKFHGFSSISRSQGGGGGSGVVVEGAGITRGKIYYDNSKRSASWVKVEITCVSNRLALVSRYQLYEKNGSKREYLRFIIYVHIVPVVQDVALKSSKPSR